jgi:hypothetical protein
MRATRRHDDPPNCRHHRAPLWSADDQRNPAVPLRNIRDWRRQGREVCTSHAEAPHVSWFDDDNADVFHFHRWPSGVEPHGKAFFNPPCRTNEGGWQHSAPVLHVTHGSQFDDDTGWHALHVGTLRETHHCSFCLINQQPSWRP